MDEMDSKNYQKYRQIGAAMQLIAEGKAEDALKLLVAYLSEYDANWKNVNWLISEISPEPLDFEQISDRMELSRQTCVQMVRALEEGGLAIKSSKEGRSKVVGLKNPESLLTLSRIRDTLDEDG